MVVLHLFLFLKEAIANLVSLMSICNIEILFIYTGSIERFELDSIERLANTEIILTILLIMKR